VGSKITLTFHQRLTVPCPLFLLTDPDFRRLIYKKTQKMKPKDDTGVN